MSKPGSGLSIFKRLLAWQKREAPAPQPREDPLQVARSDTDLEVRRAACERIESLTDLNGLLASDLEPELRESALARYGQLLCGQDGQGPDLAERLAALAALTDQGGADPDQADRDRTATANQGIIELVALAGDDAQLRRAAIGRVADPEVLGNCILEDPLATNRSAAVERLDDKQVLERVAKNIGKRDKRVYRIARQKLKEIAEREALPERIRAQCDELCDKLERLGRIGNWVQDRAMLDLLDRQWAGIEPQADPDRRSRYQDLRGRFLTAFEDYSREHQAQLAAEESRADLRTERQTLLAELRTLANPSLGEEAATAHTLERIAARWDELPLLPEPEQSRLERELETIRAELDARLVELRAIVRGRARLERLLAQAEEFREQTRPLDEKQLRTLVGEAKPLLAAAGADKTVVARFAEVRAHLDERLRKQKKHAQERLAQLPERLDELTDAVEEGSLKEAEPLYQSISSALLLIESSGLPPKDYQESATRLRALAPRLRDLQKWRKWGADQHRQELCLAMEALVDEDLHSEALTLRLQDLQTEWKQLDSGGSPANHPLWERFHAASEQVYERCKPYLEQQAAQRETNREQREQLCRDLEAFLDQADWERMDWKKASRAEREMRQAWSAIGAVDGRHRKSLEKRFRNAIKRLDDHLAQERERNLAHKRDLIARVEALAAQADLPRAIEEAKDLQRQWHTTVAARQKEENRLWQRFRAACDLLFERRKEQHESHTAELAENLRRREDLCARAEALAAGDHQADTADLPPADAEAAAQPATLTKTLTELQTAWRELEDLPVPRQAATGLAKRWHKAQELVEDRRRALLVGQRRRELDLLAAKAALCERLERAVEARTGDEDAAAMSAGIEVEWQALPTQRDHRLQTAIEGRFANARTALNGTGDERAALAETFVTGGERRAELCLHLEILAQISSPPELAEERLQFQVTRLTEHMREGEKDPLEATAGLLQEWYLCPPAPATASPALEERFQRARRAIEGREATAES